MQQQCLPVTVPCGRVVTLDRHNVSVKTMAQWPSQQLQQQPCALSCACEGMPADMPD